MSKEEVTLSAFSPWNQSLSWNREMFCGGPSEPLFRFEKYVTNLNGVLSPRPSHKPSHGHSDNDGVVVSASA